ncbi:MAG: hypothetical protein HQL73_11390 [Magnetococcales bacterium]|nr:hypothetical protein [Magnetococcales bacterium]
MAKIERFQIGNFRALRHITLGKFWDTPNAFPLSPMTAVIGKKWRGKGTLFGILRFPDPPLFL